MTKQHFRRFSLFGLVLAGLLCLLTPHLIAQSIPDKTVVVIKVDDAIGPATAEYILTGIQIAQKQHAKAVVIELDTPGGLDSAMRDIIKAILQSPVPVITYVAPSGARAASTGTYILYASSIAAMAPGTNMGAATPVSIGGMPSSSEPEQSDKNKAKSDAKSGAKSNDKPVMKSDMERKIKKDAIAYIRSLAELHGRNIDWSRKAVLEADSISAKQALSLGVIDAIANSIPALLNQVHGKQVTANSQTMTLDTKNANLQIYQPDWRIQFLSIITNPSVAYILLMIGIYGLFFEFANPGLIAPGVIGGIALILGLYALQLLPISYAALGLVLLGIAFMVAEAFLPSFGVLGLGGIAAFVLGSVMLFRTDMPGMQIPWAVIGIVAVLNGIFFFAVVGMAVQARLRPQVSGREAMLGTIGIVREDCEGEGWITLQGESWQCHANTSLRKGQQVEVTKVDGLHLDVRPISDTSDTKE